MDIELDLCRLNFALVTLIPKVEGACNMKQFRPISLLNYGSKIFFKSLTISFSSDEDSLVW